MKWQRNTAQMKGQTRKKEVQINVEKIITGLKFLNWKKRGKMRKERKTPRKSLHGGRGL